MRLTAPRQRRLGVVDRLDGVSVVVCCYNSVDRLPPTLAHVARQRVPQGVRWEVVVVDNASTDDTAATALDTWRQHGVDVPFKVVTQPTPGLTAAREKGLDVAAHDVVIFCDDDNWLAEDYLELAFTVMQSNPSVAVVGVRGTAALATEPPAWFDRFSRYYALGPQATASGDVTEAKGYVYGAGLVLRRAAWDEVRASGFRSQLTGRKGGSLASSEDRELCYALRLRGYRVWYEDALRFSHEIPERRLRWSYFLAMVEMAHRTTPVMEAYDLALSGGTLTREGARRAWWCRCVMLALDVVRRPTMVLGALQSREGTTAAMRWRRVVGAWRGWTALRHRYAKVVAATIALRAVR